MYKYLYHVSILVHDGNSTSYLDCLHTRPQKLTAATYNSMTDALEREFGLEKGTYAIISLSYLHEQEVAE